MNQLVTQIVDTLHPMSEQQEIQLTVESADKPIFLNIDPIRMRQALNNLLSNAIRHTPKGGEIVVRLSTEVSKEAQDKTSQEREVQIQVKDNGEGIVPENLPHLFDRFYRIDQSRNRTNSGTGLGLAIAKAIIEAHGGQIHASSDGLGHGSTFTIRLSPMYHII